MAKRLLVFVILSSLLQFSYSQPMQHSEEISDAGSCRIERYVTDIRRVGEDAKEISVNVLFYVDNSEEQGSFVLNVPTAEKLKITSYAVRVYDNEGHLVQKEKIKKPSISEFSKFNPQIFVSKHIEGGTPFKVELDYKLIVIKPKGFYEWPAISSNSSVDQTSLRLNFEESDDFEFNSNMDVVQEKDINTGGFYYLWNIKKLTPNGGEFNGANLAAPFVKILLK